MLTNNFDPEYGNYNGGMVTVVSKSGKQRIPWQRIRVFPQHRPRCPRLLRPDSVRLQAEPVWRHDRRPDQARQGLLLRRLSGNAHHQGVSTGNISVPTLAQRRRQLSTTLPAQSAAPTLHRCSPRNLGYHRHCRRALCQRLSQRHHSAERVVGAGQRICCNTFHLPTSARASFRPRRLRRPSATTKARHASTPNSRLGQLSGYYFIDDYNLDNPYPGSVAGASIPGFDALYIGRAQLLSLGDTKVIGVEYRQRISPRLSAQRQHHRAAKGRSRREPGLAGICHRRNGGPGICRAGAAV